MKAKHSAEHKAKQAAKLKKVVEKTNVVKDMFPESVEVEKEMSEALDEVEMVEVLDEHDLVEAAKEQEARDALSAAKKAVLPDPEFLRKTWHDGLGALLEKANTSQKKKETCVECLVGREVNVKQDMDLKSANKTIRLIKKYKKEGEVKIKELQTKLEDVVKENSYLKSEKETKRATEEIIEVESDDEEETVVEEETVAEEETVVETEQTECTFCDFVGKNEKETKGHTKFEHLRCSRCPVTFFNMEQMSDHLLAVHRVGYFRCIQCDARFDTMAELEQCIQIHRREPAAPPAAAPAPAAPVPTQETPEAVFQCPVCGEEVNNADILKKHVEEEHPEEGEEMISCEECNYRSSNVEAFTKHKKEKHSFTKVDKPCKWFLKGRCTKQMCKFSHEGVRKETHRQDKSSIPCNRGNKCTYRQENRCHFFHLAWSSQVKKPAQVQAPVPPASVQVPPPRVQVPPPKVQVPPPKVQVQLPHNCDLSKPPPVQQRKPEKAQTKTKGLWCKFQEACRDGPLCRFRHFGPDPITSTSPTTQRGQMFL